VIEQSEPTLQLSLSSSQFKPRTVASEAGA
jgi:hypothetical protein